MANLQEERSKDIIFVTDQKDYMKRLGNWIIDEVGSDLGLNVLKVRLEDIVVDNVPDIKGKKLILLLDSVTEVAIATYRILMDSLCHGDAGTDVENGQTCSYLVLVSGNVNEQHKEAFNDKVLGVSNLRNLHEWWPEILMFLWPSRLPPRTFLNVYMPDGPDQDGPFFKAFSELDACLQRFNIFSVNLRRSLSNTEVLFIPSCSDEDLRYYSEAANQLCQSGSTSHKLHIVLHKSNLIYHIVSQIETVSIYKPDEMAKLVLHLVLLKTGTNGNTQNKHIRSGVCRLL